MTIGGMPLCLTCERMSDEDRENFEWRCDAFPEGIPDEIVDMEIIHDRPVAGDKGLFYIGFIDTRDLIRE